MAATLVALLALMTVATTSVLSLSFAQRVDQSQTARRLAHSVIHRAIAEYIKNPAFEQDLRVENDLGRAVMTFQRNHPEGFPPSTNNWEGQNPVGWQRGVPVGMVHLVATARSQGVERRCEALVDMPVFPMAVACSGPVVVDRATIASISDELLQQDLAQILASPLEPGNLGSNSPNPQDSIVLNASSKVTGFVQSRGGIRNHGAEVEGELRPLWPEALELPKMSASMLDPRRADLSEENVVYTSLLGQNYGDLTISSHCVINGSLVVNGMLTVNQGLIYVDGDLHVTGGIEGEGAIAAKGSMRVHGESHLRAGSRVALLADGDIELKGDNKANHRFEGIVYGQGAIRIEKITLLGACIQNAPEGSPANNIGVVIDDANLLWAHTPTAMAWAPPIDLLIPTLLQRPLQLEEVSLSEESREPDAFVGRTNIRSGPGQPPKGPGELKKLANDWSPTDVGVLRVGFNAQGLPRFAYLWWGRNTSDGAPKRKADGSPDISGLYYPSVEALIHGRGLGVAGPEEAILARLADRDNEPPPGGVDNLASVIVNGLGGSGGYREFGSDGADQVDESALRARLATMLHEVLVNVDSKRKRKAGSFNHFSLDPSRFLNRSRAVKIRFWRDL